MAGRSVRYVLGIWSRELDRQVQVQTSSAKITFGRSSDADKV